MVVRRITATVVGLAWRSSGHVGARIGGSRGIARSKLRLALDFGQDFGPGLA